MSALVHSRNINPSVDRSGSITLGGTAQQLVAAASSRSDLFIQNISAGDIWYSVGGTAAIDTAGSYKLAAGASVNLAYVEAISIVGATTGQKFTATVV
jgi:hypothetical protein